MIRGGIKQTRWISMELLRKLAVVLFTATLGFIPVTVASANQSTGIAGGPNFPTGAEFPFVAGLETSVQTGFFIQNISSRPIELEISHGAPRGIIIEPSEGQETTFEAGQSGNFMFDITVTEPVVPGTYKTSINVTEANPDLPEGGGSLYVPAITGDLVLEVVGASAFAKLSAVSELTGQPANGDLSLIYIGSSGIEVQINEAKGSAIESPLVPGNYKFTFSVPGLQRQDFEFAIAEDESLDLEFSIPTLEFLETAAIPSRDDRGYIQSVSLTIDVFNNLGQIDEQIVFQTNISRNGELVEEVMVGALPTLPQEATVFNANYIREDGFQQGDWEFSFLVVGENFSLASEQVVVINSPGIFQSYLQEIIIAIGALVIIGLLMPKRWWAVILRRKAKVSEKPVDNTISEPKASEPKEEKPSLERPKVKQLLVSKPKPAPREKPSVRPKVPKVQNSPPKAETVSKPSGGIKNWNPSQRKQGNKDPLEQAVSIRRKLDAMADRGMRSIAVSYKIEAVFVKDGKEVLNRSTGKPYTEKELRAIREFEQLESELKQIETPEIRTEAMKVLIRERLQSATASRDK